MRLRDIARRLAQLESAGDAEPPWQMQGMATVINGASRTMSLFTDIWVPRTGGMSSSSKIVGMVQIINPGDKLRMEMASHEVPYSGNFQLRVFNHTTERGVVVFGESANDPATDENWLGLDPMGAFTFDANAAIAADGDTGAARAEFSYDPADPGVLVTAPGILSIMGTFFGSALPPA